MPRRVGDKSHGIDDWQTSLGLGAQLDFGPSLTDWQSRRSELGYAPPSPPASGLRPSRFGLARSLDLNAELPGTSSGTGFGSGAENYSRRWSTGGGRVPLRDAFTGSGTTVEFNARAKRATVRTRGVTIKVEAGSPAMRVDRRPYLLTEPARLEAGRMMVP